MSKFKIASFNVENLFERPKVFNFRDKSVGDALLARIGDFRKILKKETYSAADKRFLVEQYFGKPGSKQPPLKNYIKVREERGGRKIFGKRQNGNHFVKASGKKAWDGSVEFLKAKANEVGRENTAKVIKSVNAHVACIVEAENRSMLKKFDGDMLNYRYRYEMLIDGNDQRGIDLGLYSKFPLGTIKTHIFDGSNNSKTFSRDCPEYEVILPSGESLFILCNHLKSKGYDFNGNSDKRRKRQAQAIADILSTYDLKKQLVVVAGDLNDTPDSAPLKPLMSVPNLFDVLELQYPNDPSKRWTYHYKSFEQIDYLLISKPLKQRLIKAGVARKGMPNLHKLTTDNPSVQTEKEYPTVTSWRNAASDHGAVWAEFSL